MIETATLQNGIKVTIRVIRPDDAPRLQLLHSRLSDESLLLRFLGHPQALSDDQAQYQAKVDHKDTMAFVATIPEKGDERLIGVARYALIPSRYPRQAEAAIVVEDQYQRLGLGEILGTHLITFARKHGIATFINFIDPENTGVLHLMRRCGLTIDIVGRDGESLEVHVDLSSKDKSNGQGPP